MYKVVEGFSFQESIAKPPHFNTWTIVHGETMETDSQAQLVLEPDELKTFEYASVRVPCEKLNAAFRSHHLLIGKHIHEIDNVTKKLKEEFRSSSNPDAVPLLKSKSNNLNKNAEWAEQRFNRIIVDYLSRSGYIATAKKLAEQCGIEMMCNISIFENAKKVEESIKRHETGELINWIMNNRSRLRRLRSTLELQARMQECIEMVKQGRRMHAVIYSKTYFRKLPAELWTSQLIQLMGFIGFGMQMADTYQNFLSEDRWDFLLTQFQQENARVFQIENSKLFNACFCMGASSLRSPFCKPHHDAQCITCLPHIYSETYDLPYAEAKKTELICQHCNDIIDENNPAFMLPNGYCYCEKSVEQLKKDNSIKCPKTDQVYQMSTVVPVFTLV
ncbi:unnamed protein product [Dracunculus medinensis]|uniref:E3 ubiquitin-protein transferase MAEA n=1 Tax=Dracunculus medinensis TaxID=318479 RepID=A0A0N4UIA5_DRAME|nr:unnamed protein product [Dracunculus medinensis]